MKKRLILILSLIVLLPLAAMLSLGLMLARQERERARTRYEQGLAGRLSDINSGIARLIAARERELQSALELDAYDSQTLRMRTREQRLIRQIFLLAPDGRLLFPEDGKTALQSERAFLQRTASLWESGESFWSPDDTGATKRRSRPTSSGWHCWFWGEGLRLIYWTRIATGTIIGAEVERVAVMSDVIAQLPAEGDTYSPLSSGRIVLADAQGQPLYQWGRFEPLEGLVPAVTQSVSPPLTAWTLRYYVAPDETGTRLGGSVVFNISAGLTALALALIALAVYFYRESDRDMREAARRVTFVNQVSHELKTPLTNIRMYAELLENRVDEDDERSRSYLHILISEAQRLSRLITNVLTFAMKQRGKLTLRCRPAVVDDVIASVVHSFEASLAEMKIAIELEGNAGRTVQLDVDLLGQVLGNLINNVEKYAASATTLRITSTQDDDRTMITVADDGPGIPAAEADAVFSPFVRLSNRLTDTATGTGIGLTISRQLARLHGGDLVLIPSDSGAAFRLTLKTEESTA